MIISIEVTTETPLTNIKRLKRSKIWQLDWCCQSECLIIQPDWLKLRKTYSSHYTLNNTNQGEWWRSIETLLTNINRLKRSQISHLKWLGILECTVIQLDWLKLKKTYSSYYTLNHTNQGEWWRRIETRLTNINRLKRSEVRHLKWLGILECTVIQLDWLKLRKTYSSYYTLNHTNQGEWWRRIETRLTNINRLKRSEVRHLKWLGILECTVIQLDWLKLRKTYSSYYTLNHTNQGEGVCFIETLNTKLNGLKRYEIGHSNGFGIPECIITQFHWLKLRKSYPWVHSLSPYQLPRMKLLRWNNIFQSQWIEVKWDLSLRVLWHPWMHCHPI